MSVEAINSVQNNITTSKPLETPKAQPVEEKKNGTALLLGSLGALAIGGGIYLATRGKKGTSEAGSSAEKPLEQIKEMAIDAFKQAGNRFENGKALSADGTGYTGRLTHTVDGKKIIREYKDGIIQKSTKLDGENIVWEKNYKYENRLTEQNLIVSKTENGETKEILNITDDLKKDKKTILNNINGKFILRRSNGVTSISNQIGIVNDDPAKYFKNGRLIGEEKNFIETIFSKDGKIQATRNRLRDEITLYDKNGKPQKLDKLADINRASEWRHKFNKIFG